MEAWQCCCRPDLHQAVSMTVAVIPQRQPHQEQRVHAAQGLAGAAGAALLEGLPLHSAAHQPPRILLRLMSQQTHLQGQEQHRPAAAAVASNSGCLRRVRWERVSTLLPLARLPVRRQWGHRGQQSII